MRKPLLLLTMGVAILVAVLLAIWGHSSSRPTQADTATAAMSLNVESGGTCDDPAKPTKCVVDTETQFTLSVSVNKAPAGGYVGIQTEIDYGSLVYKPTDTAAEEIVWPDSALPLRSPASPTGTEGVVEHGDLTGITTFPKSNFLGNVVQITLNCTAGPSTNTVELVPLGPGNPPASGLLDPNGVGVPASDSLVISCGPKPPTSTATLTFTPTATPTPCPPEGCPTPAPTITPAPTATPTPTLGGMTPMPTPTPASPPMPTATVAAGPPGDVSCDGTVNSIDAALLLQFGADLIDSLPCPDAADVNGDGNINAVDAALILQSDAGLIDSLPV